VDTYFGVFYYFYTKIQPSNDIYIDEYQCIQK